MSEDPGQAAKDDYLWLRRYTILHRLQLAVRYHAKRERFFDGLDRLITVVTALAATSAAVLLAQRASLPVVGAAAATGNVGGPNVIELTLAFATALLSAVAVAYTPGVRARQHAQLGSEFRKVWVDGLEAGEAWTRAQCDACEAGAIQAEVGEPPSLQALVLQCENEIALAEGQPENMRRLGWFKRKLMQFWSFDTTGVPFIDASEVSKLRRPSRIYDVHESGGRDGESA